MTVADERTLTQGGCPESSQGTGEAGTSELERDLKVLCGKMEEGPQAKEERAPPEGGTDREEMLHFSPV